jgi:pyruvate/2-oxoglutarate/acetoin dehydrogenase E1 component
MFVRYKSEIFMISPLQTVREALASAMEEEMNRDKTVYVLGEEVARYNGAYKASQIERRNLRPLDRVLT